MSVFSPGMLFFSEKSRRSLFFFSEKHLATRITLLRFSFRLLSNTLPHYRASTLLVHIVMRVCKWIDYLVVSYMTQLTNKDLCWRRIPTLLPKAHLLKNTSTVMIILFVISNIVQLQLLPSSKLQICFR